MSYGSAISILPILYRSLKEIIEQTVTQCQARLENYTVGRIESLVEE